MVRLLPGDPAVAMAGVHATPEYVEQVREDMGLNDSLIIQFGVFMKKLFKFDLGLSTRTQRPVSGEILPRFLNTLKLTVVALALTTIVGIGAGIISASKPYLSKYVLFHDRGNSSGFLAGINSNVNFFYKFGLVSIIRSRLYCSLCSAFRYSCRPFNGTYCPNDKIQYA